MKEAGFDEGRVGKAAGRVAASVREGAIARRVAAAMTDAEKDKLFHELWRDKNPGVFGMTILLSRIWGIDEVDWKAVKKELSHVTAGWHLAKEMEKLPYFKEMAEGKYRQVERSVDPSEWKQIVREWEDFERQKLRPIEDDWVKYRASLQGGA